MSRMARIGIDIMCGIAGFSLSNSSRINARKLSHALLCEIESRGSQASGFAYQAKKSSGVFKQDVAGSNLVLKDMPRDSHTVILHTRYATHGSVKNNKNNHPVASPDSSINLVHNGVIYNHDRVRIDLPFKLPEVDTSVIPALLQKFGTDSLERLDGDAAIAWLDDNSKGVLSVARVSHSPMFIAQVEDGSFIFASTQTLLTNALSALHLRATFMQEVQERTMLTVRKGRIDSQEALPALNPEYEDKSYYSKSSYRQMTAGVNPYGSSYGSSYASNAWDRDAFYGARSSLDGYDNPWAWSESGVYEDITPAQEEYFEAFDDYLCSFIEVDKRFYDYSGNFVGTLETLREDFDDYYLNEALATKFYDRNPYEVPAEDSANNSTNNSWDRAELF